MVSDTTADSHDFLLLVCIALITTAHRPFYGDVCHPSRSFWGDATASAGYAMTTTTTTTERPIMCRCVVKRLFALSLTTGLYSNHIFIIIYDFLDITFRIRRLAHRSYVMYAIFIDILKFRNVSIIIMTFVVICEVYLSIYLSLFYSSSVTRQKMHSSTASTA